MRSPLPDHQSLDRGATLRARLAGSLIDAEVVLVSTPSIHPIDAGPVMAQPALQAGSDPPPQGVHFGLRKRVAPAQGVQAGVVQGFIHVDVAEAGHEGLIEEQRLERTAAGVQIVCQPTCGEGTFERLGPQPAEQAFRMRVSMSATGSVRLIPSFPLPAGLAHARDFPPQGELTETDTAESELPQHRTGTSAPLAAAHPSHLELRCAFGSFDPGCLCHLNSSKVRGER